MSAGPRRPVFRRRGARPARGVDLRAAVNVVAAVVKYLALAALFPAALALAYSEPVWLFLATAIVWFVLGALVERLSSPAGPIGAREGFLVVAATWLGAAAVGATPYLLSGDAQLASPVDAYFEAMSGFTTTGASILVDLEALPASLLMWRQFTQWLGGMGIIVLALAVLPRLRVGGRQLLEHEVPGPEVEPLAERIRDTARRLWGIYIALTVLLVVVLTAIGRAGLDDELDLYDAVAHAFTTLPTGGFSTHARSIEAFAPVTQWTFVAFMALAGVNFALMYHALVRRDARAVGRDEELRLYLVLLVAASAVVTLEIVHQGVAEGEEAVRQAVFQTVSIMTTTGYANTDFAAWPLFAAVVLVGLMFVGGSAGSTAGSVKVIRHLLLGKVLRRELDQTIHPELVARVRRNGVVVDERTLRAVSSFILLYVGLFAAGALVLVADAARVGLDLQLLDAVAAAATMLGNVGPAFGPAGPMGSFEPFSDVSKLVMIGLMWLGRLEVIPVVVLLTRNYWRA